MARSRSLPGRARASLSTRSGGTRASLAQAGAEAFEPTSGVEVCLWAETWDGSDLGSELVSCEVSSPAGQVVFENVPGIEVDNTSQSLQQGDLEYTGHYDVVLYHGVSTPAGSEVESVRTILACEGDDPTADFLADGLLDDTADGTHDVVIEMIEKLDLPAGGATFNVTVHSGGNAVEPPVAVLFAGKCADPDGIADIHWVTFSVTRTIEEFPEGFYCLIIRTASFDPDFVYESSVAETGTLTIVRTYVRA